MIFIGTKKKNNMLNDLGEIVRSSSPKFTPNVGHDENGVDTIEVTVAINSVEIVPCTLRERVGYNA